MLRANSSVINAATDISMPIAQPTPDRHWGIILTDPAGLGMASVPSSQLNYRQLSSKLAIEDVISFMRSPHQPNGRNFKGFAVFAE
jgi:hypothetical protein